MRKLFVIAIVLLLALAVSGHAADEAKATEPADSPVINIYNTRGYPVPTKGMAPAVSPEDLTVVKVYSDGTVVWSKNGISGGSPFLSGRVDPKIVRKFMSELDKRGVFEDKALARVWAGPNSKATIIEIKDGKKTLKMRSWHELFEKNPRLVATAGGVGALGDKSREEVQKAQPEDYKHFRAVWDMIRKTVESWTKPKTP